MQRKPPRTSSSPRNKPPTAAVLHFPTHLPVAPPLKTPLEPVRPFAGGFDPSSLQDQRFLSLPLPALSLPTQLPRWCCRRRGCSADRGRSGGRGYHPPRVEADALGLVGVEGRVVFVDGPAAQETEVLLCMHVCMYHSIVKRTAKQGKGGVCVVFVLVVAGERRAGTWGRECRARESLAHEPCTVYLPVQNLLS